MLAPCFLVLSFQNKPTSCAFIMSEQLIINDSLFRLRMSSLMSGEHTGKDINAECGYPDLIPVKDYEYLFEREGLATRFVSIFPEECWSEDPDIYETEDEEQVTEFEKSVKDVITETRLWNYLQRLDVVSGIGRYGVLLLGLDDGLELSDPVEGAGNDGIGESTTKEHKILYLKVFAESQAKIKRFVTDTKSPRFGMPLEYELSIVSRSSTGEERGETSKTMNVHWSRIIHVADERNTSDIFGTPRLQTVFNRHYDIRKIAGGSGEMFWKGAFPGFATEVDHDADIDEASAKEEIRKYQEGLSRMLAVKGIKIHQLKPQISDPMNHLKANIMLAAASKGIPYRILMGTEEAQLAGNQDSKAWARRCHRRNLQYVDLFVIRPVIDRFIQFGIVKPPAEENGYTIDRSDPDNLDEVEKSEVSERRAKAIALYVQSGSEAYMPLPEFLSIIIGLPTNEVKQIMKSRDAQVLDDEVDEEELEEEDVPDDGEGDDA